MHMSFNDFLEDKHPEYLDEGIGSWVGNKLGQGIDAVGRGIGRVENAAGSGLDSNAAQQMGLMAQKAAMSGDSEQFKQAAKQIYKQMRQAQRQSTNQPNQGQPQQQQPQQPQVNPATTQSQLAP